MFLYNTILLHNHLRVLDPLDRIIVDHPLCEEEVHFYTHTNIRVCVYIYICVCNYVSHVLNVM